MELRCASGNTPLGFALEIVSMFAGYGDMDNEDIVGFCNFVGISRSGSTAFQQCLGNNNMDLDRNTGRPATVNLPATDTGTGNQCQ